MDTADEHMDRYELLVKYITDETNGAEKLQVETWIKANADDRRYYAHFKQIWDESLKLSVNHHIDEGKAWDNFTQRLQRDQVIATTPQNKYRWLKIAAFLLLAPAAILFAISILGRKSEVRYARVANTPKPQAHMLKSVATNKVKIDTLPDGSVIIQNKNSSLAYPATFESDRRVIALSGEAFFKVRHDAHKPFIINVNNIRITVLGTSFNVKSAGKTTEVIVETGMVSVQRQQQTVTLHPGEQLTVTATSATFKKNAVTNKNYRNYFEVKLYPKAPQPEKKRYYVTKYSNGLKRDSVKRDSIK